jgi:hypothetical protein
MTKKTMHPFSILSTLFVLTMWGCAGHKTALPSSAYFPTEPSELELLHGIARTQEARVKACRDESACEEAFYTRGLVALFDNRADAINIFHELRTTMPQGRYATDSIRWLYLLQESFMPNAHHAALQAQLRQVVLRTLLERADLTVSVRPK